MKSIDNLFAKIGSYPWRGDSDMADFDALVEEVQDEIRESYVKLPLDADGVPIRFGDKITVSWSKKVYEVSGFSYTQKLASGEITVWVDVYKLEKMGNVALCAASGCHHYREPTVDDLLFSYGQACIRASNEAETEAAKQTMLANLRREYAAKLRMAGDGEGQ